MTATAGVREGSGGGAGVGVLGEFGWWKELGVDKGSCVGEGSGVGAAAGVKTYSRNAVEPVANAGEDGFF